MKIDSDQVADKKIVGHTHGDNDSVVYVLTHGGLHCYFQKSSSGVKTLAMAPHKAIARWMAEKAEPKIKWNDLSKAEEELAKSEVDLYSKLFAFLSTPVTTDFPDSPLYVAFNTSDDSINLCKKEDLAAMPYTQKQKMIVRNVALNSDPDLLLHHKDFQ